MLENYIWILSVIVILIITVIGFLADKNKSNKKVWIIAGLGNPGPEYEDTRHNCGFLTIDKLIKKIGLTMGCHY